MLSYANAGLVLQLGGAMFFVFLSDVTIPGKLSLSGGWGMTQWEAPPEEKTASPPPSSEAITTPVTRTVVDESENFFTGFLPPGDVQGVADAQVVSVPPAKSQRTPREKGKDTGEEAEAPMPAPADEGLGNQTVAERQPESPNLDAVLLQPFFPSPPSDPDSDESCETPDAGSADANAEPSQTPSDRQIEPDPADSPPEPAAVAPEPESAAPRDPSPSPPSREVLVEPKDSKGEDRQSDTPSPPVSASSSETSTTSDIEVLDHESVLSESSASSRQETGEGKAGLHLMQGSFQLLTASTCEDFPRLDDYSKLTESCGSSSDAFERIDSFSVQSLDSRSVSEVNSDDDVPGSRTLASVTAGPPPSAVCQKQEDGVVENEGEEEEEEEEEEEGFTETTREQSPDEMEESGRSATPVNSEPPEELTERESEAHVTLSGPASFAKERISPPITEEMKSVSTVQILELRKVAQS